MTQKWATGLLLAAVVGSTATAQTLTQSVTSSTVVTSDTRSDGVSRSRVTVRSDPWTTPATSTTRVIESPRGTNSPQTRGTSTQWRTENPSSFAGSRTTTTRVATVTTPGGIRVEDRNPDSPGKGWAKGKVKNQHKFKNKNKNKQKNKDD